MRIAVLASGTGTILDALVGANVPIVLVVTDRHCGAEKVAERAGLPVVCVERVDFSPRFDRAAYTDDVIAALETEGVDLVVMAGFGTILGPAMTTRYPRRVMNTHPALLPLYKGWHAVRECSLADNALVTGCTVHLTTAEVDEGPILAQREVPILPGDTEEILHERIKAVERELYPATVKAYCHQLDEEGGLT